MQTLALVAVVKNEAAQIDRFLEQHTWTAEIILVDNGSTDATVSKAKKYLKHIYSSPETNLGKLKQYALSLAASDWVLLLDADELVTPALREEIQKTLKTKPKYEAFRISYRNYFLGHELKYLKAQRYGKVRLFKRSVGTVSGNVVHEEVMISAKRIGQLHNAIMHYSFRSLPQIIRKFTDYAKRETPLLLQKKETSNLNKLLLYPTHMFYALFIKDHGFKDGLWGFLLSSCFAYYEFMRYFLLWKTQLFKKA